MAVKPPYGDPCNGCGACCRWVLCPLASHVFGTITPAPCPALVSEDDGATFGCGLILDPHRFAPSLVDTPKQSLRDGALVLCGAGMGCDAAHDEIVRSSTQRRLHAKAAALPKWRIRAAMRAWRLDRRA